MWQPINTAPIEPAAEVPASTGLLWTTRLGPELALLCWHSEDAGHMLIRGAWHTRDGGEGVWWDLECGQPIDLTVLAWVPMPAGAEIAAMVGKAGESETAANASGKR